MMKYVRTTRQTTQGSEFEGFSILEVVIVIAVISLLLALVVPAIQSARDSARRIDCSNRMHQIGLAVQLFESAHRAFPSSDPDCDDQPFRAKFRGLKSWQFQLLPYLDQVAVYEKLEEANTIRRVDKHLMFQLPILHCPAETVAIGMNYRFCAGRNCSDTSYHNSQQLTRGFGISAYTGSCRGKKISDITDGLSNTILMSERTLSEENTGHFNRSRDMWFSGAIELGFDPFSRTADDAANSCAAAEDTTKFYFPYVGHNLITYGLFNSVYSHVLPPNSKIPDCSLRSSGGADPERHWNLDVAFSVVSARSLHRDGSVNALYGDGSVRLIAKDVDLTVWRSQSTIADDD